MTDRKQDRVRQLLSAWRGGVVPVAQPQDVAAGRDARVDALARMIRKAPLHKRSMARRRWASLAIAASVLTLIGTAGVLGYARQQGRTAQVTVPERQSQGKLHFVRGHVVATSGAESRVVRASEPWSVQAGDEIDTAAGATAVVEFNAGARVDLASATSLHVERAAYRDHVLRVGAGRVDVNVPEGEPERRSFVVHTPNARISVHGTIFSVEVAAVRGRDAVSRVQVTRGVVSVESDGKEVTLRAGQNWDSHSQSDPTPTAVETSRSEGGSASPRRRVAGPSSPVEETAKSTLAEEVRLYEAGLTARERGDFDEAQVQFQALLDQFPRSQMAQAARVELQAARTGQRGVTRRH